MKSDRKGEALVRLQSSTKALLDTLRAKLPRHVDSYDELIRALTEKQLKAMNLPITVGPPPIAGKPNSVPVPARPQPPAPVSSPRAIVPGQGQPGPR